MELVRRARTLAWAALRLEVTLYRALGRWITRRPEVPAGTTPISYSGLVAPMLWLWIFGSATEVVVLDGIHARVDVPLEQIASVRSVDHDLPGLLRSVHVEGEGDEAILLIGVGSRTNLELVLTAPTTLHTPRGPTTVGRVALWVDEPREVADVLRRRRSAPLR